MSERYENFIPRKVYRCPCLMHIVIRYTKYQCTSQSDNDFLVISLKKRYCKSCIRHYCEKMCKSYPFKVFDH